MLTKRTSGMTRNGGHEKASALCDELEKRAQRKDWVCPPDTPRVLVTGTPMFWPDSWKVPNLVEEANPKGIIVADELCSGETNP